MSAKGALASEQQTAAEEQSQVAAVPAATGTDQTAGGITQAISDADTTPLANEELLQLETESPTGEAETDFERKKREEAARRVREAVGLPPAVREKLARILESGEGEVRLDGKFSLPIEACLKAIEESLPDFLRANRDRGARREHPEGDGFFRGSSDDVSDEQAEALARGQLARSGFLRG